MAPKPIYTFGDSHAWHCWLKIPGVTTNPMGPMTMWTFGKGKPVYHAPPGSIMCICSGEIDCRCHVFKHPPWGENIEGLVERYLQAIDLNQQDNPENEIWIFNVVPPPRKPVIENPAFPFMGSDEERLDFVRYMNLLLMKSKYKFVNVYDAYSDEDGYLRMEMSDYHVHIADEKPLIKWIEENNQ